MVFLEIIIFFISKQKGQGPVPSCNMRSVAKANYTLYTRRQVDNRAAIAVE